MRFDRTILRCAWLIESLPARDHRGFFAGTFCAREYADHRLTTRFVQHNTSHSAARGTLRGMHFQRAVPGEVKVVSCLKGAIWDVINRSSTAIANPSSMAFFDSQPSVITEKRLGCINPLNARG
jgi:dTDP-4-dehydrorhamnose 3,5-epimerase-like enzyme